MPFVNHHHNSPERITHLSDQWHAANAEWKRTMTKDEELNENERAVLDRMHDLQRQLLGKPSTNK